MAKYDDKDCCWSWQYKYDTIPYRVAIKQLRREDRPLFKKIVAEWKQAKQERDCKSCLYFCDNYDLPCEGYSCYLES